MDDYNIILGHKFFRHVKIMLMLHFHAIQVMDEQGSCFIQCTGGAQPAGAKTSHSQVQECI